MSKTLLALSVLAVLSGCSTNSTSISSTTAIAKSTLVQTQHDLPTLQDTTMTTQDRHLWLEDITGDKPLAWVRQHNITTDQALASTPRFDQIKQNLLRILNATDKIPYVVKRGEFYYNFWTDDTHKQGIWRRTTWQEYHKPNPQWELLL